MRIRPIKNKTDHQRALARIEALWSSAPNSPEADELDVLSALVDAYEDQHEEFLPPDPIEAIRFRMEQQGLSRKDLQRILKVSRGRVSEILNRKRGLSLTLIRRLVERLHIPAEILIQQSRRTAAS